MAKRSLTRSEICTRLIFSDGEEESAGSSDSEAVLETKKSRTDLPSELEDHGKLFYI